MENQKPVSDRKLASARANGAKSKGPVTPEGKERSSMNALRHGLCANTIVLQIEDREQYNHLRDVYVARFEPRDEVELDLVEEMVNCKWRQRRNLVVETETLNLQIEAQEEKLSQKFEILTDQTRLAVASNNLDLDKLHRYETRLARQYSRAYKMLMELKKNDLPKEPNPKNEHGTPDVAHASACSGELQFDDGVTSKTRQQDVYGFQSEECNLREVPEALGVCRIAPELGGAADADFDRARALS